MDFFPLPPNRRFCLPLALITARPSPSRRELYDPLEEEGLEPETVQIDPEDLAGWNQVHRYKK